MISIYDKHNEDLAKLKTYVKEKHRKLYYSIFRDETKKTNYPNYIGMNSTKCEKKSLKHCAQSDFYSFLKTQLKL